MMRENFQKILANTTLLPKHREELKTKRGFTDEVIDSMQFKSCSERYIKEPWYTELPENFQFSLSKENILIPYLNLEGAPYHMRPHKYGIKDLGTQVFIPYKYIGDNTKELVLAESEFKALASCLMGAPSIGIPGIASFSGKKFNSLVDLLTSMGVARVVICFDREIKGDKNSPNYKKDFKSRYDTEFYSYIMAQKLIKKGIPTKIALLNRDWMKEGKIDIDGILASNISHDKYIECIKKAMDPWEYRNEIEIPYIHKSYLERRIDRYFYDGNIVEKNKCYYYKKKEKSGEISEYEISNFTIHVHHTVYDGSDKAERLCKFISKYGNTSTALLTPDVMVSKTNFQKFCYERGDLEFFGNDTQLQEIWRWVFMNQDGIGIKKLAHWGYDEVTNAWFFSNGAYRDEEFYPVDDDGIVWIGDEGYKVPEFNPDNFTPPTLSDTMPSKEITIEKVFDKMKGFIEEHYARLLLGWTFGNFFLSNILKEYKVYPFLFMYGKMGSGKSTYANICSSFFGYKINGVSFSSTPIGIMTASQTLCGPPIWIDEFRNSDPKIADKINILRSIYDRSTRIKASKKVGEVKAASARSTIILSGEEYPKDAAFNSRCIQFPVYRDSAIKSANIEDFNWVMEYKSMFNQIGHYILMNKESLWKQISNRIKSYNLSFEANDISLTDRSRIHHSIVGSVADILLGIDESFAISIAEKAIMHDSRVYEDQALYVFFEDLNNMNVINKFSSKIIEERSGSDGRLVNFAFNLAYAEWEHQYRGMRNDIPASRTALMEHLKREKYFVETKQARIGKKNVKCVVLKLDEETFPHALKTILDNQSGDSFTVE